MNSQAQIQKLFSIADTEQLIESIENLLELYTGIIIALFAAVVIIAAIGALLEKIQARQPGRETRKIKGRKAASSLSEPAFDYLSLDSSSIW